MGAFFSYSLQSALCLAVFYLFYTVVLSRETFHRLNRCMLLFIMALSWIIPLFAGALSFRTGAEVVPEMLVEQPLATLTAGGAAASLYLSVWQSVFVPVFTLISSASPFAYFIRLCLTYGYGDCSLKGNTRRWIMISG